MTLASSPSPSTNPRVVLAAHSPPASRVVTGPKETALASLAVTLFLRKQKQKEVKIKEKGPCEVKR